MKKKIALIKKKQIAFCVDKKMETKLKKLTKLLKFKTVSETIRHCIEYTGIPA